MRLSEAIQQNLRYHLMMQHTPATIRAYDCFLHRFLDFTGDIDLSLIDKNLIQDYLIHIRQADLSRDTIKTYEVHLKAFLCWAGKEHIIEEDLYQVIKPPKTHKRTRKIYSEEEIKRIFESVKSTPSWITDRNRAIIALMLDSGLRQSEITLIRTDDYDVTQRIIKVCGKGNKERWIPVGKLSAQMIATYKNHCPYQSSNLFVNRTGKPLSKNSIKLFLSKISKELDMPLSSHKLRHNFATNYVIDQYEQFSSCDIYRLMYLMGHEEVSTTQGYLHLAQQYIAAKSNVSHLDLLDKNRTLPK